MMFIGWTAAAPTVDPPLDKLGRCVNMSNVMRDGVLGDCDSEGRFIPQTKTETVAPVQRTPRSFPGPLPWEQQSSPHSKRND